MSEKGANMPDDPDDDLVERLLAAEEAGIRDDGFSARVTETAGKASGRRSFILYGAGLMGFGFALGGIVQLAPKLPPIRGWTTTVAASLNTAVSDVTPMLQGGGTAGIIAIAAVAGLVFSAIAVAAQGR